MTAKALDEARRLADFVYDMRSFLSVPPMDERTVHAVKALGRCAADAADQKVAVEFILHRLAGADNQSFVPHDPSGQSTAFLEGRRFVGRELRKIFMTPAEKLIPKQLTPRTLRKPKVTNG